MMQPFSQSTSKLDADATDLQTVEPNTVAFSDKLVSSNRRTHGGEIIYQGWQFGDWIDIQIVHPVAGVVNQYVKKIILCGSGFHTLDTRPLAAFIPAGLYIRVNYHAVATGSTRSFFVNFHLYEDV